MSPRNGAASSVHKGQMPLLVTAVFLSILIAVICALGPLLLVEIYASAAGP